MLSIDVQELRDITIIIFAIAGTTVFVLAALASILTIGAMLMAIATLRALRSSLQPALEGLREAVDSVRGTTAFLSETAVSPVFRVYRIFAGGRRFLRVAGRLFRRR